MIRLAVSDVDDTLWQQIAPRLRGTTIESCGDHSFRTCDAGVFFMQMNGDGKRFVDAGKRVLLLAEDWWMSEAVQALPGLERCAVVNLDRYLPSRQLIRQQLDAGKLGEPGLIRVHNWATRATEIRGPHGLPALLLRDLDLVLWYFGNPPNLVYAVQGQGLQVHLGFPGGGMALLDITHGLLGVGYCSLAVIGSAGAAYADDHQNMQLLYRGGRIEAVRTPEWSSQIAAAVQEFVDAVESGRDLSHSLTTCRQAFAVDAAVEKSLRTRRAVEPEGVQ